MSAATFALILTGIAIAVLIALYFGVMWVEREPEDEPTEHGDGE